MLGPHALVALLGCTEQGSWVDSPLDGLVNAHVFELRHARPTEATVTCALVGDSSEVHRVRGEAGEPMVLYGLLADARYTCALATSFGGTTRAIQTGALPEAFPSYTLVQGSTSGFTLLNHNVDTVAERLPKLLVLDELGRIRWYHCDPRVDGCVTSWPARKGYDVDTQYLGGGRILMGGGDGVLPTILGLDGTIEAQAGPASGGREHHHHTEQLADGTVVALAERIHEEDGLRWKGFSIDLLDPTLDEQLWSWDSAQGIEEGWLEDQPDDDDPYHANALTVLDDVVLVSLFRTSQLAAISRRTGQLTWWLGAGGDYQLLTAHGLPAEDSDWFYAQHAPKVSGDRLLLHDNGLGRPGGIEETRVLELQVDHVAKTVRERWRFTEPGWFEPAWGDVDWLPEGNVLITRGHCDRCDAASPGAHTEILEVDPERDEVTWRLRATSPADTAYRASRIGRCEIFSLVGC